MFLYEYMDSDELQQAKESALLNLESAMIQKDLILLEKSHELNIHGIDVKVMVENGTDDYLAELYQEEMEVYTESVKDLWDRFVNWLKKIWNKIRGVKPDPSKVKGNIALPFDPNGVCNDAEKAINFVDKLPNFIKTDGTVDKGKVGVALGISVVSGSLGAMVTGFIDRNKKKTVVTPTEAVTLFDKIKGLFDKVVKKADELKEKIKDTKVFQAIKNFIDPIVSKIQDAFNWLKNKLFPNKDKEKESSGEMPSAEKEKENPGKPAADANKPNDKTTNGGNKDNNKSDNSSSNEIPAVGEENKNESFDFGFDEDQFLFESCSDEDAKELYTLLESL